MLKFLIPVDGSEPCAEAVKQLIRYLGWINQEFEVMLLNVQPPVPYRKWVSGIVGSSEIARYQKEEGLAALKGARKVLDDAKIPYQHSIAVGEPVEVITRYARENGCDQIIMGTRGMGSVSSMVMGSVASKVLQLSAVPVLMMTKRRLSRSRK